MHSLYIWLYIYIDILTKSCHTDQNQLKKGSQQ